MKTTNFMFFIEVPASSFYTRRASFWRNIWSLIIRRRCSYSTITKRGECLQCVRGRYHKGGHRIIEAGPVQATRK